MRTYAIGDIHGRADLLEAAFQRIAADCAGAPRRIICLGDYVDRGPDSRAVVERLLQATTRGEVECLKGNHEDLMVRALRSSDEKALAHWLLSGGFETLASYGVGASLSTDIVPASHLRFLESLPVSATDARRIFVHAGLTPDVDLGDQDERSLLWIRERFLDAPGEAFGAHVVHGHTFTWAGKPEAAAPERLPHRTNLDTGAYHTGVLSVGVFDDSQDEPLAVWTVTIADAVRQPQAATF